MKILFLVSFIFVSPIVLSQDCETSFTKMLTYEQAREKVRELGIRSTKEYELMNKEKRQKLGLPVRLRTFYINKGWRGAHEFFETKILPYEQAQEKVQELGIKNEKQYELISRKEKEKLRLPARPREYYANKGWRGMRDFFGTEILSYEKAKNLIQEHGIKNTKEYNLMSREEKEKLNLPTRPREYYTNKGWIDTYDFFGRKILSYEEAKKKVQELGVRNKNEYRLMNKEKRQELGLPARSKEYYANKGWQGADDFFDTKKIKLLSYEQAKNLVSELGIRNVKQYKLMDKNKRKELKLPLSLEYYYQKTGEWRGTKDFFRTKMLTYEQAKNLIQELGVRSLKEYKSLDKNKLHLPVSLFSYYQKTGEWKGSQDFFEKKPKAKVKKSTKPTLTKQKNINEALKVTILSYKKARKKVQKLGVQNFAQYRAIDPQQKKRLGLPDDPYTYYAKIKEWKGADDFFGYYIGDEL